MKMLKKTLSVFMAALMLFTALSVGTFAAATDAETAAAYRSLAYSFFDYDVKTVGFDSQFVVKTDEDGLPVRSIVGVMDQYVLTNASDEYTYADDNGEPIRAIAYDHLVTAKDNADNDIRNAALEYLSIVEKIISYEYDKGLYTIPMVAEEIAETLMFTKGDDGEYLFLDGYTYVEDAAGHLVAKSPVPTYEVDGDRIEELDVDESWMEEYAEGYNFINLYQYLNVATIVDYFSGNCTAVNSGNWFHSFAFHCYTDLETVLLSEGENIKNSNLTVRHLTIEWDMERQYDDSGTVAQYYNGGYKVDRAKTEIDDTRPQLVELQSMLDTYFMDYYAPGKLDNLTNDDLLSTEYDRIREYYDVFDSISDNAKIAVFGQAAYSYMNLVTQLTPIANPADPRDDMYWPCHTYEKYKDDYGNYVEYQVDAEKVTTIVSTIDDLLKSPRVGKILTQFFDYTDPQYADQAYYQDALVAETPQDILKILIADLLFQDDIINMLLELLYPMVTNLLDENLTDEMLFDLLGETATDLIYGLLDEGDGLQSLIYAAVSNIGVALTPAGMAWVWNKYGYLDPQYGYTTTFPNFQAMHDELKAAKGGGFNEVADHSMGDYYGLGSQYDEYCGDRWRDVDFSVFEWGINGDKDKFLLALDAILAPLAPLLAVLLGDSDCTITVTDVLATPLRLILNNDDQTLNLYNKVLLPLFETLGLPGLLSGSAYEQRADAIRSDSARRPDTISAFLNDGLLNPILNWVTDVVLADPINTVLQLLPNLSYYLTSGALLGSLNGIEVKIMISHAIIFGATISVYTLDIMELIGEDTVAFLDSLQGILDLIGFDVDTGIPIIGYVQEGYSAIYAPTTPGYNPDIHNVPVTEGYVNAYGDLNLNYDSIEYTTYVSGLDENGEYTDYAVFKEIGWKNDAGNVVTAHNNEQTEEVYHTPVTSYYECTYFDVESDMEVTSLFASLDDLPDSIKNNETLTTNLVRESVNAEESASLPAIMDYKLQATGTKEVVGSGRYGTFTMTNKAGNTVTWAEGKREYISLYLEADGERLESGGLVLLFLFRYIFSAVKYRNYNTDNSVGEVGFTSDYTLLDAFGLDQETLNEDLFAGLSINSILNSVVLAPDGAIAALYELFYKNEFGSLYTLDDAGNVIANLVGYTYDIEYVDYHADEIMGYAEENNDYTYGTAVLYSEYWTKEDASYFVDNLDEVVDNVLQMLKLEDMSTIGEFLEGMISDLLFSNDMLSSLASMLYGLLGSMGGIDLPAILDAALEVDMSKQALCDALVYEFGEDIKADGSYVNELGETVITRSVYTQLQVEIRNTKALQTESNNALTAGDMELYQEKKAEAAESAKYSDNSFYMIGEDIETAEEYTMYAFDWGYNNEAIKAKYDDTEIFLRALSAIASPFAIIFRMLFAGEDLSVLGLINIPFYEMYFYSWIPLMETLGATDGLLDFKSYYTECFTGSKTEANCDTIYYTVKPIFGLVERVIDNPIELVFNMIPNLLFFISIGAFNDVVNNIVHFAYVLLDILQPVLDAYPIVNSLLSNIRIGDVALNLSLPLDFDFNQLVNDLLEGLLGESLAFDIENKNIVLGTEEVEKEFYEPVLDADGNEQYDEEGNVLVEPVLKTVVEDVYAVGTLKIKLPYIDFTTLCAGTVVEEMSVSGNKYLYLDSAGGADLITLIFRIVTDTLFFEDNAVNIANFLIGFCQLDDEENNDDLLMEIFVYLNGEAREAEIPDVILKLISTIYKLLVPIAGELGTRFAAVDFSITDLFESIDDTELLSQRISALMNAGGDGGSSPLSGFGRLIQLIKEFFAKIAAFFAGLFGG